MGLKGRAFNAMWSNLLESSARELDRWHTIEHMMATCYSFVVQLVRRRR